LTNPDRAIQTRMLTTIWKGFPVEVWRSDSPFRTLIHTILSQNTNDRNSDTAFRKLRKRYRITPKELSKARVSDVIECIRTAGLYRSKAPNIIEVSRIIDSQYHGRLSPILKLPYAEAKERLTDLPGVGPKTADILLAFAAKHSIVPVDTHIARVSKRLGITPANADYERIRKDLERVIPPDRRLQLHLSLIGFGRAICKAPTPRCGICPVNDRCPSSTVKHGIR
jgi:endonuclease-3